MKIKNDFVTNSSSTSFIIVDMCKSLEADREDICDNLAEKFSLLTDKEKDDMYLNDEEVGEELESFMEDGEISHQLCELVKITDYHVGEFSIEVTGDGLITININGKTPREVALEFADVISAYSY